MPDELEPRLERLLSAPASSAASEQQALRLALAALPVPERRRPIPALLAAAAAVLLVLAAAAAAALAAAGALHVELGAQSHPAPAPRRPAVATPRLLLPAGSRGIAAVIDGRLWLTTRSRLRIEALPVEAAALSPHALYVAAGIGDNLVVMAPDGRRAWSEPAPGPVRAIAWAPDGLEIAYIVGSSGRFQLRLIEGDGDHDRLLERSVRLVTPSWRGDALALAYVGAGGRPVVYDLSHETHRVITAVASRDASRLAFAARGSALAVASSQQLWVTQPGRPTGVRDFGLETIAGIGWLRGQIAVALNPPPAHAAARPLLRLLDVRTDGGMVPGVGAPLPGHVQAVDVQNERILFAVRAQRRSTEILTSTPGGSTPPRRLLQLPTPVSIAALAIR